MHLLVTSNDLSRSDLKTALRILRSTHMYLTSMHCHVKSLAGHTQFLAKSVPKETLTLHILSELIFHSFCSSCYQEQNCNTNI